MMQVINPLFGFDGLHDAGAGASSEFGNYWW
jgi:hypothetical protein